MAAATPCETAVRELQNVIERSAILCSDDTLIVQDVLSDLGVPHRKPRSSLAQDLEDVERANIVRALEEWSADTELRPR